MESVPPGGEMQTRFILVMFTAQSINPGLASGHREDRTLLSPETPLVRRLASVVVPLAAVLALVGCGGSGSESSEDTVDVVATTTQIGDWVAEVGGEGVTVHQILQPNTDPHDYEPKPSDVQAVAEAQLIFANGDDLDGWVEEVASDSGSEAEIVDLSTVVPVRLAGGGAHEHGDEEGAEHADEGHDEHGDEDGEHAEHEGEHAEDEKGGKEEHAEHGDEAHDEHGEGEEGGKEEHAEDGEHAHEEDGADEGDAMHDEEHAKGEEDGAGDEHAEGEESSDAEGHEGHSHDSEYDPHWWHDPTNAEAAVEEIERKLSEADPSRESEFEANADEYLASLEAMDEKIAACIESIPADERKMVTDHEAFGYFANRYGIEVVGAVIPSQTTQGQASAKDLSELAEEIEHEGVKAVFPETSVSSSVAEAIADQTGATAEYELYGDSLGPADSDGATYIEMEEANANAVLLGFTGGERGCD